MTFLTANLTFELDGAQDQSLAVVFWPQVSGHTFLAATAAAGIVVRGWAYQDLALDVHWLCGSQKLEGLKCETGIGTGASDVGLVGVVHGTSKGETDSFTGQYQYYACVTLTEEQGPPSASFLKIFGSSKKKYSDLLLK